MPFSFLPKKTEAQTNTLGNVAGYASGITSTVLIMPQCQGVRNGIKDLFNSGIGAVGSLFSSSGPETFTDITGKTRTMPGITDIDSKYKNGSGGVSKDILNYRGNLDSTVKSTSNAVDSLQTNDEGSQAFLGAIAGSVEATRAETKSLNENSTCITSIGRLIAKMLLQKLTMSTVDWINNGFDGSPSFIQDPEKFFNNIAKTEILQFDAEIKNINPYSKDWLKNQALAYKTKFADNARYSLNELIQQTNPDYSATTFQTDFSLGGWDAWTAMTQIPANNPLGAKLMFDNEMQKRLAGTSQSVAQNTRDALQAANGFLGDQRCSSDPNITQQENTRALEGDKKARRCTGVFEYVTPGKLISEAATTAINYQNNALLNVQDLNDAVASIVDALLSQFSSNIFEKGFANIGNQGSDGTLYLTENSPIEPYKTQTQKDYQPSQLSSSWLQANPDFNIRTDLTQALIDEQRTYSDKLALQNKELMSTTDGKDYTIGADGISNAYGLMPAIYQLDYCIPGPHPGWEQDSQSTLAAVTNLIVPETENSIGNKDKKIIIGTAQTLAKIAGPVAGASVFATTTALGASIGSFAPVIGTVIGVAVGAIVAGIISLFGGDSDGDSDLEKLASYYAIQIQALTGLKVNPDTENDTSNNILSKQGAVQAMNEILNRYTDRINKFFNPKLLPTVSAESTTNFYQLTGYAQMIKDNKEKILEIKTTVSILGEIKDAVDALNAEYPDGGDEYESRLKTQINAFGRLSANMVNGDDIASADNLYKQIIDKKVYIYDNLLKGPYGCEKDLENKLPNGEFPFQVRNTKRMTYPFPIIYDYNKIAKDASLPDPWNSGLKDNKMTFNTSDVPLPVIGEAQGPGFLSYVFYQTATDSVNTQYQKTFCTDRDPNTPADWCMIEIRDLLPLEHGENTLGAGSTIRSWIKGGQFEITIGIY